MRIVSTLSSTAAVSPMVNRIHWVCLRYQPETRSIPLSYHASTLARAWSRSPLAWSSASRSARCTRSFGMLARIPARMLSSVTRLSSSSTTASPRAARSSSATAKLREGM